VNRGVKAQPVLEKPRTENGSKGCCAVSLDEIYEEFWESWKLRNRKEFEAYETKGNS